MDSDMKIFKPAGAAAPPLGDELDNLAAQTEELRESGDLGRAKRLGRELAAFSAQSQALSGEALSAWLRSMSQGYGFHLNPEWERHLHVLMVFSGQQALRAQLQPQLLSEAAVTAMNNFLINRSKAFWDTISDGSAFTQYLLAVRGKADVLQRAAAVGGAFAHVCGQEDNPDLRALGTAVFNKASELVAEKWGAN
jgi:hypothetical protein